jgi:hypothetical protein
MAEALEKYRALSVEDKRAADLCFRPSSNNRTMGELFESGVAFTVAAVAEAVAIGREMIADGFTEDDALAVAEAGR